MHPSRRNRRQIAAASDQGSPKHITADANHKKRTRNRRRSNDSASSSSSNSSASSEEQQQQQQQHDQYDRINNRNHRPCRRSKRKNKKQAVADLPTESNFIALDCEMVGIGTEGYISSLARVTLIDWNGQVLFDEHVQQTEPVTDYRTFVSGITLEDLDAASMSLEDCRGHVSELLHDHILVGHALKNDMKALGISHPWWLTRDTAKYKPFMQVRFDDGIFWPRKLKNLVQENLHQEIQIPGQPHSPLEDALAALGLYKSVQRKWEKVIQYKVEKTHQIQAQQQQQQQQLAQ